MRRFGRRPKPPPPHKIERAMSAVCPDGRRCYARTDLAWKDMAERKGRPVAALRAEGFTVYRHRKCGFWHAGRLRAAELRASLPGDGR